MKPSEQLLPLWARRLICRFKGHRRGVRVDEPPYGKRVFKCPRCERRTQYRNEQPAVTP